MAHLSMPQWNHLSKAWDQTLLERHPIAQAHVRCVVEARDLAMNANGTKIAARRTAVATSAAGVVGVVAAIDTDRHVERSPHFFRMRRAPGVRGRQGTSELDQVHGRVRACSSGTR